MAEYEYPIIFKRGFFKLGRIGYELFLPVNVRYMALIIAKRRMLPCYYKLYIGDDFWGVHYETEAGGGV